MRMKMNNMFIVLFLMCIFSGCEKPSGVREVHSSKSYSIVVIDGCEYIECDYGMLETRVYSLTHKGNCKNKIHLHKIEK